MRRQFVIHWLAVLTLPAAAICMVGPAQAGSLALEDAVRQTLEGNIDLAARRKDLDAAGQNIQLAQARLLPQVDFASGIAGYGKGHSVADSGREADGIAEVALQANQVVYDETLWADFTIEKRLFAGQQRDFQEFRLGIIQDSAVAFLEVARAEALLRIQIQNLSVTKANLDTAEKRLAAGYSSRQSLLRWQSQIAVNEGDVVDARNQLLLTVIDLNRIRNRPAEEPVVPGETKTESYGFVYAEGHLRDRIGTSEGSRRLRDFMVDVGLRRSPALTAIDESIAAQERQLAAARRAFWLPRLNASGTLQHILAEYGAAADNPNETQWNAGLVLSFPLLQGGAKFADEIQAVETLSSLRLQRRSAAQNLEQEIRSSFSDASAAFAKIGFAKRQADAARENYELVNDSYVLGVASILLLLDAQDDLLSAELKLSNAVFDFLEDLIAAERQVAFYPFLASRKERAEILDGLEQTLGPK